MQQQPEAVTSQVIPFPMSPARPHSLTSRDLAEARQEAVGLPRGWNLAPGTDDDGDEYLMVVHVSGLLEGYVIARNGRVIQTSGGDHFGTFPDCHSIAEAFATIRRDLTASALA